MHDTKRLSAACALLWIHQRIASHEAAKIPVEHIDLKPCRQLPQPRSPGPASLHGRRSGARVVCILTMEKIREERAATATVVALAKAVSHFGSVRAFGRSDASLTCSCAGSYGRKEPV